MSFAALAWAAKQKTGGLATKSVLLALANYADEHGCAYPSTAAIAAFGEMDHKTATTALDRLVAAGLIADTGERAGRTKQVKVYQLNLESHPESEAFQNRKPPVFEPKAPQKRGTDTVKEPTSPKTSSSPKKRAVAPSFVPPSDIPEAEWDGYEEMRRRIGKPMTAKARDLAIGKLRKLAEAGYPPGDVLNNSILNSWQGLFPPKEDRHEPVQRYRGSAPQSRDGFLSALGEMGQARSAAPHH
ncbi:helix-turn-helix domain-containing protein [Sphingomonas beigongshangi]|uniref:helix-turn-helix domain-containing protein n=1 Tax=Sphingomonas beigongshangi TaxID=2782540 RepID=UPI00193AE0D6|nr:helix-turn-helix domain-containing protein [Sphingomonas beigongshangi]